MEGKIFYREERPLKRFIMFAYYMRRPSGALEDALYSFDNLDEALESFKNEQYDFKSIFDSHEGLEIDVSKYGIKY